VDVLKIPKNLCIDKLKRVWYNYLIDYTNGIKKIKKRRKL